jgi:uncharacterized membrane protein YfcA
MNAESIPVQLDAPGVLAVIGTGLVAGFFNVTAGGGSLLTLPLLILLGLPAPLANGTNRVALVVQNLVAVPTFRRGGVRGLRAAWLLVACALPGTILGAWAGATVSDAVFRRVLGVLMLALTAVILLRPPSRHGPPFEENPRFRAATLVAFALLGLYAGFVQAGIGFLITLALAGLERFPLLRAHAFKVTVVLALQSVSLVIFAGMGQVSWSFGALLSLGLATGGWLGARLALRSGEPVLRILLVVGAVALGVRMLAG